MWGIYRDPLEFPGYLSVITTSLEITRWQALGVRIVCTGEVSELSGDIENNA